jgi:hypothetical protein
LSVTITDPIAGPFVPNGLTTAFPFDFKIAALDEISVLQMVNGVPITVNPTNYNVVVASDGEGGTVTFTAAPLTGSGSIYIASDPDFTQQAAFGTTTPFNVAAITDLLDRAAIRDLVLLERLGRTPQVPVGESIGPLPSRDERKGKYLSFDPVTGDPVPGTTTGPKGDPGGNAMAIGVATAVGALNLASGAAAGFNSFRTDGYRADDDNGGAWYRRMAAPEATQPGELLSADGVRLGLRKGQAISPEMLGAAGDGATDDYDALQALVALTNLWGGAKLEFGLHKTYFVNRFATSVNGITDFLYNGCNGLTIEGNGSKIETRGGFDRADALTRGVIPLQLRDCTDVVIRNLELDGNIETITNSIGGTPASYGIELQSCFGVLIENCYSHHFVADGIKFRESATLDANGKRRACRNVTVRNSKFKFNGRMAASVIQVRGLVIDNCEFSYSGFVDEVGGLGTYVGGTGPTCGMDIEPNNTPTQGSAMDIKTGDILLRGVRIVGNASASFLCSKWSGGEYWQENVSIRDSWIECNDGVGGGNDGFIFDCPGGSIENCDLRMRDRTGYFGYFSTGLPIQKMSRCRVYGRNSTVTGVFNARAQAGGHTLIEHCDFTAEHTVPKGGAWFFDFSNTFSELRGNRFWLPKEAYTDGGATDLMQAILIKSRRASDNTYETDLLAASGSSGTAHYGVMYDPAVIARGERMIGTATDKWIGTIRPGDSSTSLALSWNTNVLFDSNKRMARVVGHDPASLALGAASAIQSTTVTGAALSDRVTVEFSLDGAGVAFRGAVSAVNTVKWWAHNEAGANPTDLAAGDVTITVERKAG